MNDSDLGSEMKQAEMLEHILAIGQAIQQEIIENPKRVYQLIVETVCQITGADCAVIYPYHPAFGRFYDVDNVAAYGLRHELPVEKKADKRRRLTARVHREGEIICEDIELEASQIRKESPFITREGVEAFMGLSLKLGDDIVGILYVDYREPHRFSAEEKRIIRLFGQQTAMAVSNSWTFRLASIRTETVTKLKTIGQTLVAIEDPSRSLESVLDNMAHGAQEVLDADIVDLYQYIQVRDEVVLPATLVGERRHPDVSKTKIYDDDVVVRAVKVGVPQYSHDAQATSMLTGDFEILRDDVPDQRFVVREGVVSSATIPLMAAGETVGVMFVNYRTPQLFGPEQKDVIESFAAQAAIAIYNARLFQLEEVQRQQSDTLREVARVVNSALERDRVIDLVLEQLGRVIEYDSASVQLIEGDHRTLVGGRGFLMGDSPERLRRNVSKDPLVSKIVRERQPLVLSHVDDEPQWEHIPETDQVNSWIGVPLVVRDQVIGLLTVDHNKAGFYTQESGNIVTAFANQVALAIHNAELFSQEKHRSRVLSEFSNDFAVLHEVANNLAQQPTLEQIYQTAVRAASDTLHCNHSTIFILDKELGELAAVDRVGALEPAPEVKHFKLGEGLAGIVAKTGESIRVNDAAKDKRFIEGKVKPRSIPRSIILAPIKIEDEVIGVISADKEEIDGFTEHNLRVLEMLALDVGVAINVHRQLQQLSNQAQVLTELNALAPQLVSIEESPQETRTLLEQIAASARQVLRADLIELYEYVQERNEYRLPRISVGERRGPEVLKEKIHEDDAVFKLIRREEPLYVANAQEDDILSGPYSVEREERPAERFVIREGIQSTAAIPLRTGTEVVGLMFASYRTPQTFTQGQKEIIELFANQAAIAIHNSRLFNESVRHRNELQVLNEIGETLTSGIRLHEDSIVQLIYEQVLKLTRTQDMYIALYDEKTEIIRFPLMLIKGKPVKFKPRRANMKERGRTEEVILLKDLLYHRTHQEAIEWYESPGHAEYYGEIGISFLGLPMIIGDKVLGVIALTDWDREYAYDEQDQQTLLAMASQAAIALDNAALYARRVRDIEALSKVGQTLTLGSHLEEANLDQDQILKLIHQEAQQLIGAQDLYIALYDQETGMIEFPLMLQEGKQITLEPRRADMKKRGKTEEIIVTRKSILHRTKQESEEWYAEPEHQEFKGDIPLSWLGVPMMVGNKVLGVIALWDWGREYAYDEQDLHVLSSLASQAAIGLDNASLYQAFSTVQKITNAIKTYEELPVLLQSVLDVALPYLNAKVGTIQLLDETSNELVLEAVVGEIEAEQSARIPIDQGITGRAAREGKAIYVADTSQDNRFLDYLGGMRSELAIPLKSGQEIIGVFNIEDPQPNAFDEATRELAQLIADQSAIVIQNAQRYAKAREELIASRQLAALGTATAAIQHRINNTLNIIVPNLTRLRRRVDMSDEVIREVLDIIERNAHYTSDYIQRIQEPLKETKVHEVDINLSLREAQAKVREQYQDKAGFGTVEVKYNLADSLPLIQVSLSQITEIFHNLIENSYKAMGAKGGALTIVSRCVDDWLEVEVQDNGPGIPPKILDKLFSKPVPSKQPGEGAGLGLWLSGLLLQKYAGEITMEHTSPAGTTMLVRLPVSKR